jgi:hypothetical protein
MIETYRGSGDLAPIVTLPAPGVGRVFLGDRLTADAARTRGVAAVLAEVTQSVGYFADVPGCG